MNMVEPYISIRSPIWTAPTLIDSAQASMVPARTGVPAARPVADAAASVTWPAISPGHRRRGISIAGAMRSTISAFQVLAVRSYSGLHWLAEW